MICTVSFATDTCEVLGYHSSVVVCLKLHTLRQLVRRKLFRKRHGLLELQFTASLNETCFHSLHLLVGTQALVEGLDERKRIVGTVEDGTISCLLIDYHLLNDSAV